MEKLMELILSRQSVRRYSPRQVSRELLEYCLEAARMAPSASNSQPWTFVVADEQPLVGKVAKATYDRLLTFNRFVSGAPVIVAFVMEKPRLITRIGALVKERDFKLTDHGIAATHFCLAAAELGLGTCMLGWFNEKKVKQLLGIPRRKRLSMLISVGFPEDGYHTRQKIRKPFHDIVHYNSYKSLS